MDHVLTREVEPLDSLPVNPPAHADLAGHRVYPDQAEDLPGSRGGVADGPVGVEVPGEDGEDDGARLAVLGNTSTAKDSLRTGAINLIDLISVQKPLCKNPTKERSHFYIL